MFAKATVTTVFEWITARWRRCQAGARTRHELLNLRTSEMDAIAASCELSAEHFIEVVSRGPNAADELAIVMKSLGVEYVPSRFGGQSILNRMKVTCADCNRKPTCRASIRNDTIARDYQAYCNNADAIGLLKRRSKSFLDCRN